MSAGGQRETKVQAAIKFGEGVVTVRRRGGAVTVARVLGTELDTRTGLRRWWLDRLIHRDGEDAIGGQGCGYLGLEGAFVTVLSSREDAQGG